MAVAISAFKAAFSAPNAASILTFSAAKATARASNSLIFWFFVASSPCSSENRYVELTKDQMVGLGLDSVFSTNA